MFRHVLEINPHIWSKYLSHINNNNKNTVKEIILYCAFCEVKTDLYMNLLNFIVVTNRIVSIHHIAILFSKSCLGHPLGYWAGSNNLGHIVLGLFLLSVADVTVQGFDPQAAESVLIKRTYCSIVAWLHTCQPCGHVYIGWQGLSHSQHNHTVMTNTLVKSLPGGSVMFW